MVSEFYYKGHHFELVPIENSTDYSIIKDSKDVKRIKEQIAKRAIEYVDKLF